MRIIFWSIFIAALIIGCKPKQNVVSVPSAPSAPSETSDEMQVKKDALNNLVISLYSIGGGSNYKAAEAIESFLQEYPSKIKRPIPYSKIAWGREGETDFCISLAELNADEKRIFTERVRELIKPFELIHFYENHPCRELK